MTKTLVIAEKPSVAQDIVRALTPVAGKFEKHDEFFESEQYVVTSAVGHLVEIQAPEEFDVKRGNPSVGASTATASSWVTREYQICLKCHSTYAYDVPPELGFISGGTPSGTNAVTRYTDQAMEFQAPLGESSLGDPKATRRSTRGADGHGERLITPA